VDDEAAHASLQQTGCVALGGCDVYLLLALNRLLIEGNHWDVDTIGKSAGLPIMKGVFSMFSMMAQVAGKAARAGCVWGEFHLR
jgi:hypothetical protein